MNLSSLWQFSLNKKKLSLKQLTKSEKLNDKKQVNINKLSFHFQLTEHI